MSELYVLDSDYFTLFQNGHREVIVHLESVAKAGAGVL